MKLSVSGVGTHCFSVRKLWQVFWGKTKAFGEGFFYQYFCNFITNFKEIITNG